jgi:hypothetical protein
MKKLLFVVILMAIVVGLTSCEQKKADVPLEGNENLFLSERNGLFSVKQADGTPLLLGEFYETIKWDNNIGVIVAKNGAKTTLAFPDGGIILTEMITKIEPAGEDFYRIVLADQLVYMLAGPAARQKYNITGDGLWGKMKDIVVDQGFVFMKGDTGRWGVANISPREGLAPTKYKTIYILKTAEEYAVLVENVNGEQTLYDAGGTSGAEYDMTQKEIQKMLKNSKIPDTPYGVIEGNWQL